MSLTKDGDGLLRLFEMLLFFLSMWQKGKITSVQGTQYQSSFYFVKVYILCHWEHCMCDEPNDYSDPNIFLYHIYKLLFYKFCKDKWW